MQTQSTTRHNEYRGEDAPRPRGPRLLTESGILAIDGALEVHRALCAPELQRVGQYEIASRVLPARHVGGDFICTVVQPQHTFAVLGDLMGKGLSAAMWITHIVDLVHRAAERSESSRELMERLNKEILISRVRAPLTSAVALCVDQSRNEVWCTLAGHPSAVVVRANSSLVETISEGGPIMGVFTEARYSERIVRLEPGDSVVAFSDGVTEAHNEANEEFSEQRALSVLSNQAGGSVGAKVSGLLSAVMAFAPHKQFDDISILALQRS